MKMEWLESVKYANDPAGYSYNYVQEQIKEMSPELLAQLMRVKSGLTVFFKIGYVTKLDLLNMQRAENYSPFSYTFGWGINSADWTSGGSGRPFVDELLKDIININDN